MWLFVNVDVAKRRPAKLAGFAIEGEINGFADIEVVNRNAIIHGYVCQGCGQQVATPNLVLDRNLCFCLNVAVRGFGYDGYYNQDHQEY